MLLQHAPKSGALHDFQELRKKEEALETLEASQAGVTTRCCQQSFAWAQDEVQFERRRSSGNEARPVTSSILHCLCTARRQLRSQ